MKKTVIGLAMLAGVAGLPVIPTAPAEAATSAASKLLQGGYVRIESRWRPGQFINVENALTSGPAPRGWHSADWAIDDLGDGHVRIGNRFREGQYLHVENGRLQSGPIQAGWESAQWVVEQAARGLRQVPQPLERPVYPCRKWTAGGGGGPAGLAQRDVVAAPRRLTCLHFGRSVWPNRGDRALPDSGTWPRGYPPLIPSAATWRTRKSPWGRDVDNKDLRRFRGDRRRLAEWLEDNQENKHGAAHPAEDGQKQLSADPLHSWSVISFRTRRQTGLTRIGTPARRALGIGECGSTRWTWAV